MAVVVAALEKIVFSPFCTYVGKFSEPRLWFGVIAEGFWSSGRGMI